MKGYQIRPVSKQTRANRDYLAPHRQIELEQLLLGTNLPIKQVAGRMGLALSSTKQYCGLLYGIRGVTNRIELMHREIERLKKEILWWKNES